MRYPRMSYLWGTLANEKKAQGYDIVGNGFNE